MDDKYSLGSMDCLIIGLSFFIAAAIGIKFKSSGGHRETTGDYLMGGKNMPKFPVMLSFLVTNMSAVTMLGQSAEVYKYGSQLIIYSFAIPVGLILSAYIVMPVYFQCGVSSIYEYLEQRFGKLTRSLVSAFFVFQLISYMSLCLYAPALALSAVTNLSIELSIILVGFVCTFYCSVGGLKAVMWTDVFQALLMILCLVIVYVTGIIDSGGISTIYKHVKEGGRLIFFDLSLDFSTRYTFFNVVVRGLSMGFGNYGTCQIEVQRMLSLGNYERALSATLWSCIPVTCLMLSCNCMGLVLYSIFYLCDPVTMQAGTGVSKYDQLLPYYIVKRLNSFMGLTGLCVAGIFSGSLSTISSALNSLSTVTVIDCIQSFYVPSRQNDTKMVFVAKGLVVLYGILGIGLAFSFLLTDSILLATFVLVGIIEGPVIAVFLIGMLTTIGTDKSVSLGLISGTAINLWIGFEVLINGYPQPTLPLSSDRCTKNEGLSYVLNYLKYKDVKSVKNLSQTLHNSTAHLSTSSNYQYWFRNLSFMWLPTAGFLIALCTILIFVSITDRNKRISPDSKCLSPLARLWISRSTSRKDYISNRVSLQSEDLNQETMEL